MSEDYNQRSRFQRELQSAAWETFRRGVAEASECLGAKCGTVLELGCATGGNSVEPLQEVRTQWGAQRDVLVYQCDLPSTAWATLMKTMAALKEKEKGMHFAAIGSSFYEEVLPKQHVDFVFSFTALHWVREHNPFWRSDDEYRAYQRQQRGVDESFKVVVGRIADVLKPRGAAFLSFPCARSGDADATLKECGTMIRMWYALRKAWTPVLALSAEEDEEGVFGLPKIWRSLEQVREYLQGVSQLQVLHCEHVLLRDPFDDASEREWAEKVADTVLAVCWDVHLARATARWPERVAKQSSSALYKSLCGVMIDELEKVAGPPGTRKFGIAQILLKRR